MNDKNILQKLFYYLVLTIFTFIGIIFLFKKNLIVTVLAFIIILLISKNKKIKHFEILLFIISLLIRLIVITVINSPQIDDSQKLLEASYMFARGDYSFSNTLYFKMWGYQIGLVIYQGILLKLFNSEFLLKFLNITYSSLTVVIVYKLSKKFTNEKAARITSMLYMIYPKTLIMNTYLYNQILSAFLMYMGIYILLKDNKNIKDYIISSIFIALGNIIRPEGIVIIFSLLVYIILIINKTNKKDLLKKLSIFIIIYLLIGNISSFIVKTSSISKVGLKNTNPIWKFVLGFNYESCGTYNIKDESIITNYQKEKETIINRIKSKNTPKLLVCKTSKFWLPSIERIRVNNNKTYNLLNFKISYNIIEKIGSNLSRNIYTITLIMSIIGVIINKNKLYKNNSIYLVILFITTFFVYELIEINSKYTYFIVVSIFILSSYGYEYIINNYNNFKKVITKSLNK